MTAPESGSRIHRALGFLLFVLFAVALAAYLHLTLPGVPDRDALYHFRHAALYREFERFRTHISRVGADSRATPGETRVAEDGRSGS